METKGIKIVILTSFIFILSLVTGCKSVRYTQDSFSKIDYHKVRVPGRLGIADGDTIESTPALDIYFPSKMIRGAWGPYAIFTLYFLTEKQYLCFYYNPDRVITPLEIADEIAWDVESWELDSSVKAPKHLRDFKKTIETSNDNGRINVVIHEYGYNIAFLNIIPGNLEWLIETVTKSMKIIPL